MTDYPHRVPISLKTLDRPEAWSSPEDLLEQTLRPLILWCGDECNSEFKFDTDARHLYICFAESRDAILFKMFHQ